MGSDTRLVHKEILFFMVFTNLIIGISYTSLPRAQFLSWRNLVKVKKRKFFWLTTHSELPYSIPGGSYCILACGKNQGYKGPSKAAFPSRMISHADTSGLGYFIYHISSSHWG